MISVWDSMLHNLTVLSREPLAKIVPASLNVTKLIDSSCPLNSAIFCWNYTSQIFIKLSSQAVAKIVLLLLKAIV